MAKVTLIKRKQSQNYYYRVKNAAGKYLDYSTGLEHREDALKYCEDLEKRNLLIPYRAATFDDRYLYLDKTPIIEYLKIDKVSLDYIYLKKLSPIFEGRKISTTTTININEWKKQILKNNHIQSAAIIIDIYNCIINLIVPRSEILRKSFFMDTVEINKRPERFSKNELKQIKKEENHFEKEVVIGKSLLYLYVTSENIPMNNILELTQNDIKAEKIIVYVNSPVYKITQNKFPPWLMRNLEYLFLNNIASEKKIFPERVGAEKCLEKYLFSIGITAFEKKKRDLEISKLR